MNSKRIAAVIKFTPETRLLFFAPHPDDESLAGGGLIQQAVKAGGVVLVVFATDGDNNPWPQRCAERKAVISGEDRLRWGARRRREAALALEKLAAGEAKSVFLGLPDQGLTEIAVKASDKLAGKFLGIIEDFSPSVCVAPSMLDTHPDHNSLAWICEAHSIFERLSRDGAQILQFVVHPKDFAPPKGSETVELSKEELLRKENAIRCHETQMVISRKRFLGYAKNSEEFIPRRLLEADVYLDSVKIEGEFGGFEIPLWRYSIERWLTYLTISLRLNDKAYFFRERLMPGSRSRQIRGINVPLKIAFSDRGNIMVWLPVELFGESSVVALKLEQPLIVYDKLPWKRLRLVQSAKTD